MGTAAQEKQNQGILDYALNNFSSQTHEYGREDMAGHRANRHGERVDGTRFNADRDGDGRKGVDCSSMVYYALQGAGFDLDKTAGQFTTATLFNGRNITPYAEERFDVLPASSKTDGSLKAGDILMMKMPSGAQHVGIFKGYDDQGRIQFFGSQTSTGPETVTLTGNNYWDNQTTFYGALRPKEEFIKPEFRQTQEPNTPATPSAPYQRSANGVEPAIHLAANGVPSRYVPLHNQIDGHIKQLYTEKGVDWANGGNNTVASCTVECVKQEVTEAQFASVESGQIKIGQKDGFMWNVATVDAVQAARTPQQESFAQLAALDVQQSQQQDNPTQTQTKTQSGPSIG